jgi:hypothetical protein
MARKPARKAANHAQWISWDDACGQGHRLVGRGVGSLDLVAAKLSEALVAGKIPAIDRVVTDDRKVKTFDLSLKFWRTTVTVGPGRNIRSQTRFVGWWPNKGCKLPGGIAPAGAHNIFLNREGINALWPTQPVESAASQERKPRTGGRSPGPAPTRNWPMLLAAYIIMRQNAGANITTNDSKLANEFCEYCSKKFDWQPEQSAVRDKIPELLQLIR